MSLELIISVMLSLFFMGEATIGSTSLNDHPINLRFENINYKSKSQKISRVRDKSLHFNELYLESVCYFSTAF